MIVTMFWREVQRELDAMRAKLAGVGA